MELEPALSLARERWRARLGAGTELPLPGAKIVVRKTSRILEILSEGKIVATFPIALGRYPTGPKERKGDSRTPEGSYAICTRNPVSVFHLFLGISYPNAADARAAQARGEISWIRMRSFISAEGMNRRPNWDTGMGGAIGLHGGGTSRDWTEGCVAMENEVIEELWVATEMGTPVEIVP